MPKRIAHVLAGGVLLGLAACSAPAADPEEPEEPDPTPSPEGYTPAEQSAILAESIDLVYCGSDPVPEWCAAFVDVAVDDTGWANVRTTLTDAAAADVMCTAIAGVTYDDDAEPIGVHDVMVFGNGGAVLTDCDVVPLP
jgi:hypothetical protein